MSHKYVSIERYIETHFEDGSRPAPKTVRAWIEKDQLEYEVMRRGARYYIDLARPKSKNPVMNRILNG